MNQRSFNYILTFLLLTSFLFADCATPPQEVSPSQSPASAQSTPTSSTASSPGIAVGHGSAPPVATAPVSAPGTLSGASGDVKWTTPTRWKTGPEKPMRAATYLIPAAAGDSEGAECAVFMNIGGGVNANIKRWVGQFEQPDGNSSEAKAKQKKETINGFPVTTVDLTGIFTGGGMAMGQPSTKKPGYRLLGAIVEGPEGEVFFKLTGPAKTVAAAQGEFQALLKSLKK
jgi:hypothetical protein